MIEIILYIFYYYYVALCFIYIFILNYDLYYYRKFHQIHIIKYKKLLEINNKQMETNRKLKNKMCTLYYHLRKNNIKHSKKLERFLCNDLKNKKY